jgi:leader peptidase (prepilin peptidase) / N-methyltransferase
MLEQMILLYPGTSLVFFALFSLAIGSLLNVIIYRLPLMIKASWTEECRSFLNLTPEPYEQINLFFPRSFCPNCKSSIPFWHNIPILSYLILRGKSHCCHQHISLQYPLVEALTLGLSLAAWWFFGVSFTLFFSLIFIWALIVIAFIDLKHTIIPDSLSLGLMWVGLLANTSMLFTTLPTAVFSAVGGYLSLWLFMQLYYLVTGKIGMGNGDFKLFAAFGAWFGGVYLPFILVSSSLLGAVVGIIYLKTSGKHKDTPLPFGPFLCISGLITLFYGHDILYWYISLYQ